MTRDEALGSVAQVLGEIAPEIDVTALDPGADLREEADLDSLDFLTMVERLAALTGVEIPESAYDQVRSLDGLAGYLAARTA